MALFDVYLAQNKLFAAHQLLQQAQSLVDLDIQRFDAAQAAFDKQRDQQVSVQRQSFDQNPTAEVAQSLSALLYNTGDRNQAFEVLVTYLSVSPNDDSLRFRLMQFYAWDEKYPQAIRTYQRLNAPSREALLLYCQVLAWQGDVDSAQEALKPLLFAEDLALRGQAQLLLGNIYLWKNNPTRAIEVLTPLQQSPTPGLNLNEVDRALARARSGRTEGLSTAAPPASITQITQQKHQALLRAAQQQQQSKNFAAAATAYDAYLAKEPNDLSALKQLAYINIKLNRLDKGLQQFATYAYKTYTADALAELAQNYLWAQRTQDALRTTQTGLAQFPEDKPLLALQEKALAQGNRLTDHAHSGDQALLERANALYADNDFEAARPLYADYLSRNPTQLLARERYADSLSFTGVSELAAPEYYFLMQTPRNSLRIQYQYGYNLALNESPIAAQKVLLPLKQTLEDLLANDHIPPEVERFLSQWQSDWQSRDFNRYASHYSEAIRQNAAWQQHKQGVFSQTQRIKVDISQVHASALSSPTNTHHYQVSFLQHYRADTLRDIGVKTLDISCDREGCLINDERWQKGNQNTAYNANASQAQTEQRQSLLVLVNEALEKLNLSVHQPKQTDTVIKSMFFSPGVSKIDESEALVLSELYGTGQRLSDPQVTFMQQDTYALLNSSNAKPQDPENGFRAYAGSFDRRGHAGVRLFSHQPWQQYFYRASIRPQRFSHDNCSENSVSARFTLQALDNPESWEYGGNLGYVNNSPYLLPYASLYTSNDFQLTFSGRRLFHDRPNCRTLVSDLDLYRATIEKYQQQPDGDQLWYAASLDKITDGNLQATGQFWYEFYQGEWLEWDYQLSANGWYITSTKRTDDYFSPNFYDASYAGVDAHYPLSDTLALTTKSHLGASLKEEEWFYLMNVGVSYQLGEQSQLLASCEMSQAVATNSSPAAPGRAGAQRNEDDGRKQGCRAEWEVLW
ncbi:MAG: tetratricopeptide repeat protein [Pontibacterium sp.]